MLRGIKNASTGWLGRAVLTVIMGLLVISFAVWGIGDIFRGFGRSTVATIGSTEVTIEQFRVYYTERMTQLSRRLGRPVTPAQARALGLDRQLVGQFVAETALDERARSLGLGIADAEVVRKITEDPNFRGLNGQFDRNRFEQTIRQAGYNETSYVNEQRKLTIRRQIALSISGEMTVPDTVVNAIFRFQNEKRNADTITLGPAQAGEIAAPSPEALTKFYEDRKILFRAPETRKVTLLSLTPADVARWETVSDADARKYYEANKDDYGTPERRQLRQIVFPKKEDATAAYDRIKGGLSFADLAKERALKDTDTDLGFVTKKNVIDPAVADAAFALKVDEVSAPVQGRFGQVLVQVTKIEPAEQKTYESVAESIKRRLAENNARNQISDLRNKIEDERAAGSTLAEAARKLNLTATTIEAVDRSGNDAKGEAIKDLPQGPNLVRAVFATEIGVENDPLQIPGGGYLWYDVAGVTPARDRTLDEVKNQVEERWRANEVAEKLKAKAEEMLVKLKNGTPLSQIASEAGLTAATAKDMQRGKAADGVAAKVVEAVFNTPKGQSGTSEGDKTDTRVVFTVTEATVPEATEAQTDTIETALESAYSEDLVNQYVARLEKELGVRINEQALNQVTGVATN
ncbi:MAG: peptidyl-prolyl cis-trans isomerase [Pseudolabrys sp.]